jgi:DNA polymerase-1
VIFLITGQQEFCENDVYKISTVEECIKYCQQLSYIGCDSETTGFSAWSNKLLLLQLGDKNNQYVIDYSTVDIKQFKTLLESKDLIFHNAQFDLRFLYHHRIVPTKVHDTFLAECIIQQGLNDESKGLKAVAQRYCQVELDKSVRGQIHWRGLDASVIKYAARDVEFLETIYLQQLELIKQSNSTEQLRLEEEYVKVLAYIAYSGMKLDVEAWQKKCNNDKLELHRTEEVLNTWAIESNNPKWVDNQLDLFSDEKKCKINWNSQKQVIPIFKDLGFDLLVQDKKTGKMKYSVEEPVLLGQISKHPLAALYLDYKKSEKVVSTYGENWFDMINPVSQRIHTSFWQLRDTFRLSSGSKNEGTPNFQNIPSDSATRECFIPEKGKVFIDADYSSMEVVVFTNLSKEENLIKFFQQEIPGDMHCHTARQLYPEIKELSDDEIKKHHKDKRQNGKIGSFTLQFGGQGFTIAKNLGTSVEEGEAIYNAYMKAYPGVEKYFKVVRQQALQKGYILINEKTGAKSYLSSWNRFKEIQKLIDWDSPDKILMKEYYKIKGKMERAASNFPTQGSSAIINKVAGVYIFRYLQEHDYLFKVWFPNVIHDQNLLEAPIELAEEIQQLVSRCMVEAGDKFCDIVKLKADADIKTKWTK